MDKKTKIKFNILAIVYIMMFSFAIAPKTLQNDTYYTIATGKYIVEHGIDGTDPFAWTELKYTYPHWLYDVFIYKIYSVRWYVWNLFINYNFKHDTRSNTIYNKYKG